MRDDYVAVPGDWPAHEAARLLIRHGLRRAAVIDDDGRPVGVVTLDEIVRAIDRAEDPLDEPHVRAIAGR